MNPELMSNIQAFSDRKTYFAAGHFSITRKAIARLSAVVAAAVLAGSFSLTAASQDDTVTTATVGSGIVVDFGSRTNTAHYIPEGILGVNHVDWLPTSADEKLVAAAGFNLSRTYANVPEIYATRTPNWSKIDPQISELRANGFHVLMQLSYTPPWLQPSENQCGSSNPSYAPPTSAAAWGQLAQAIVAHMDATFPGVVTNYEIWNEPDSGGMCGTSNKMDSYMAIYAAAAPLIKAQARGDGFNVRVGGPTTSYMSEGWFKTLLTTSTTAPYVDFVSYHNYTGGTPNVDALWDTNNGHTPLYQLTQNTTTGGAAIFALAAKTVATGKQPLGAATPIYVDEFNTNWTFKKDCCRDDPTYAPLWNALYVSDLLDTVYTGTSHVPGQLTYYSANTHPYFCIVGDWDSAMDCELYNAPSPTPYPQYYAYQLMSSSSYLGMNSGGYMAAGVSPLANQSGVVATAFYTSKQDSVLIANPTGTTYTEKVTLKNVGYSSPSATLYQVVSGRSINHTSLKLTESGSTYTTSITVPGYAVLGISIE